MRLCPSCGQPLPEDTWSCPACGKTPESSGRIPLLASEVAASDEAFDPAAFAFLIQVEADSFWFRARNRLIAWALDEYAPEAESMLEAGCGTGFVLAGLRQARPGLRLVGGEPAPEALAFARKRVPDVELLQLDARRLPFSEEFDVVGAFDVIEHIEEDELALASIRGAVRPGGTVLLTVPQHPRLWSASDESGHHKRRYTRRGLVRKVRAAGLEVERVTSFVSLLLPAMYISRLRQRRAETYDAMAEYGCSPRLNAALERVLGLELALIRRGVSFPAGGTLMVVARRR